MPAAFKKYIIKNEDLDGDGYPETISATYQLGVPYDLNDRGERIAHRNLRGQVGELSSIQQESDMIQDALDGPLDPVTAQALEVAQQDHDAYAGGQIAQAQAKATKRMLRKSLHYCPRGHSARSRWIRHRFSTGGATRLIGCCANCG